MRACGARSRRFLIVSRWVSIIWCGLVAGAVYVLIEPAIRRVADPCVLRLGSFPAPTLAWLLVLPTGSMLWFVGHGRWRGFFGVRFLIVYPPLWVAVLLGSAFSVLTQAYPRAGAPVWESLRSAAWLMGQIPTSLWALIAVLSCVQLWSTGPAWIRTRRSRKAGPDRTPPADLAANFDAFLQWLRSDEEITSPDQDRFDHKTVAERIAGRLTKNGAPTIALVGPRGSGKSTIRALVEHYLRETPNVRLVAVSLWPFDSPEAAVRGLLRGLVSELGRNVNILPLVGLSDDYVTAIEKSVGVYGGIARLVRRPADPEEVVQRLSDMACAVGIRLVLWVEDLERFSGEAREENEDQSRSQAERLGPIHALLHLLDRSDQISVVLSDTSLRTRFDIEKIARFIEEPPRMSEEEVLKCMTRLRGRCLGGYPAHVIDPALPGTRQSLVKSEDFGELNEWLSTVRDRPRTIPAALAEVMRTPRSFKWALRLTLETWEALPGEIDFDTVLVASALRVSQPDLFSLIRDHIGLFKHGMQDPFSSKPEPHPLLAQVDLLLSKHGQIEPSLRRLLKFVFPRYASNENNAGSDDTQRPQALSASGHADYWHRYLALAAPDPEHSDQAALSCIAEWRARRSQGLIERLAEGKGGNQVESFVGQFDSGEVCRLLVDLSARLKADSAADWEHGRYAPGIVSVWRMMLKLRPSEGAVAEAIETVIRETVGVHLPLVDCVCYFFVQPGPDIPLLVREEEHDRLKAVLGELLAASFSGQGATARLRDALRDGSPWVVSHLSSFAGLSSTDGEVLKSGRWNGFASTLLSLAEESPEVGVPLLVPLFTNSDFRGPVDQNGEFFEGWSAHCDWRRAELLFEVARLVRVLLIFTLPDGPDDQLSAACRAAAESARAHLEKGHGSEAATV